ncbi:unnamed protein product, partial [Discosporangium mesarthrocarpum]
GNDADAVSDYEDEFYEGEEGPENLTREGSSVLGGGTGGVRGGVEIDPPEDRGERMASGEGGAPLRGREGSNSDDDRYEDADDGGNSDQAGASCAVPAPTQPATPSAPGAALAPAPAPAPATVPPPGLSPAHTPATLFASNTPTLGNPMGSPGLAPGLLGLLPPQLQGAVQAAVEAAGGRAPPPPPSQGAPRPGTSGESTGAGALAGVPQPIAEPPRLKALMKVLQRLGAPVLELAYFPPAERGGIVTREPNEAARGALQTLHALRDTLAPPYSIVGRG